MDMKSVRISVEQSKDHEYTRLQRKALWSYKNLLAKSRLGFFTSYDRPGVGH